MNNGSTPYLRDGVRRGVHELGQVHHALPLVLGDVDALDGGEAGVGVPEVLQLELPLGQTGPSQLHKHLPRHVDAELLPLNEKRKLDGTFVTLCFRRTMS